MARSSDSKKLSLWQGRFRRFLNSGLAVARFCEIEHVSESSFYYWQKKLGARRRAARAEGRDACSEERDAYSEDHGVFRPVTVVPAGCGVLVRLPGGTQIEVGAEHLDAIGSRSCTSTAAAIGCTTTTCLHTAPPSIGREGFNAFSVLMAAARSASRFHRLDCLTGGFGPGVSYRYA